jgi:hypothetical protein
MKKANEFNSPIHGLHNKAILNMLGTKIHCVFFDRQGGIKTQQGRDKRNKIISPDSACLAVHYSLYLFQPFASSS